VDAVHSRGYSEVVARIPAGMGTSSVVRRVGIRMGSLFYRARFSWDHRWTAGHMSAYVDGELASRERLRLERHVRECQECRGLLAGLRDMLDALHRLPPPSQHREANQIARSVRLRLREPPAPD
jgi:Putative zinc-finger